jgi:hypothetical protein
MEEQLQKDYILFFSKIKDRIQNAQIKAAISANSQMLLLYWQLGKSILENQSNKGWGAKIIPNLAKDLAKAFPQLKGFSERNLKYMKKFAEEYSVEILHQFSTIENAIKSTPTSVHFITNVLQSNQPEFVQQPIAQIYDSDNQINIIVQQPVALLEEAIFYNLPLQNYLGHII